MDMILSVVFMIAVSVFQCMPVHADDCVNIPTYEGAMTLSHGASACAALKPGETDADKGKHFVTCSNGNPSFQDCAGGLRYDTKSLGCNWPQLSTCSLSGEKPPSTQSPNYVNTGPTQVSTQVDLPQGSCNSSNCALPNCFCYGGAYTAVNKTDTPQFIMLTFDDAVTAALYEQYYRTLLIDNTFNLTNPNGCNINSAFYTINENTDYSKVVALASAGNEIASHTIHHILAQGDNPGDYANISTEIAGMRDMILQKTGDTKLSDSLVGFRAPYLRVAGDIMFQVLKDKNFLYDTSITNIEAPSGRPPLWPFTLDYLVKSCLNPPCPTKPFPGLWEVPLNGWVGDDGFGCGMIDGCNVGESVFLAKEQNWYNYYARNFRDHFYKNKVPMHMFTHASMFIRSPGSFQALVRWLHDTLTAHNDVWLVSPRQVIGWMKQPQTNADMIVHKWGCKGV